MSSRTSSLYLVVALTLLTSIAQAQTTYPSSVVDAQLPIPSTDGFSAPHGLAVAPGGIVYVADTGNHRLLKITPAGTQTTLSLGNLSPAVQTPTGLAMSASGDLYFTDLATNRILKLPAGAANALSIIYGPLIDQPVSIASDASGNLAIANAGNNTVVVRRAGGSATLFNSGSTVLIAPQAVAFDNTGMLYVADAGNPTTPPAVYRFPKLGGTGTPLTPAGYSLKNITGLALDDARNLYLLDGADNQLIEVPITGATPYLIPQSNFSSPTGLALDNLGNLYVSDSGTPSSAVTEFVYNNAAHYPSLPVGTASATYTYNFSFYERTAIEATRAIGGGVWSQEYHLQPGGTCKLMTYYPSTSAAGATLPATCSLKLNFKPTLVGGIPGAAQVQTSSGTINQLTFGIGTGPQLALLNAAVSLKLPATQIGNILVNPVETQLYFTAPGGTYSMPIAGNTPTLVSSLTGTLALNGAGDLFLYSGTTITKIPGDGSPSTDFKVSGLFNPQSMAMDPNGAFYITDEGPNPSYDPSGSFLLRVSSTGVETKILPGAWSFPTYIATDGQGNIVVANGGYQTFVEIQTGSGSYAFSEPGPYIGGASGGLPVNLTVDPSGTLYFWDAADGLDDLVYSPPGTQYGPGNVALYDEFILPLYTVPGIYNPDFGGYVPFIVAPGNQAIAVAPSGKMYIANGNGPGLFLVDRTQGRVLPQAFHPGFQNLGGNPQTVYVYNIGNQGATFNNPAQTFTQTGNGVGSFTFSSPAASSSPCAPGIVLPSGNYCSINVTQLNSGSGPTVTDTLHFLTNAVNNNAISFNVTGTQASAPK